MSYVNSSDILLNNQRLLSNDNYKSYFIKMEYSTVNIFSRWQSESSYKSIKKLISMRFNNTQIQI